MSVSDLITAAATLGLAVFAWLQIRRDSTRRRNETSRAAFRALGPSWLARRNCEAAIRQARGQDSCYDWIRWAGRKEFLDILEKRMLTVVRLASECATAKAAAGHDAFTSFLAYADIVTSYFPLTGRGRLGDSFATAEDREDANARVKRALEHLWNAVAALQVLAPRREHEPALPPREDVPLLTGSPVPRDAIEAD
jgi:hypothetical protein